LRLCAIDIGLKRIGLATCVFSDIITPKEPILRQNRDQAAKDVDSFLKENDIDKLIVGFPKSSPDMQKRITYFISLLSFDKEICYIDEDMSSIEAEESTKGVFRHKKDGKNDSIAASIILKRYLSVNRH
jgi:putative Holliday junction resolvase